MSLIPSSWMDAIGTANSSGTRVNRPTTPWYQNSPWSPANIADTIGTINSSGTRVNRPETWWYQNSPWSPTHFWSQFGDPNSPINSGISNFGDFLGLNGPDSQSGPGSGSDPGSRNGPGSGPSYNGSGAGSSTAKELEYYYADLARMYGMNRETAYAEAMANTSYQRAVADMQNAGLNPAVLFSASKAGSAGTGHVSGSSGGGSFSSGKGATDDSALPGWMYYGVSALAQIIGTVATKSHSGGFFLQSVAKDLMRAYNGR